MARCAVIIILILGLVMSHTGQHTIAQEKDIGARVQQLEQTVSQDRGRRLYRRACAACHGRRGDGRGPAAQGLHPKPQDFTTGMYKFRSTPLGAMPTDTDLVRTLNEGIPGTAMPAWKQLLSAPQQMAIAQYLKTFATDAFMHKASEANAISLPLPPAPAATPAHVQRGRAVYERLPCAQCHGQSGRGDGPLAIHLRDAKNQPIRPPNFTHGIYKSGPKPEDLLRTIWTGLAGTPMPSWSDAMSIEESWDLVYYIRSLSKANTLWQRVFVDTAEAHPGR